MKLLIILLCLFSERFLIHSVSYRRFSWFPSWSEKIKARVDKTSSYQNPWLLLAAFIMPILLPVGFIYLLVHHILWGLTGFILSTFIFFYCLGPKNIFYPVRQSNNPSEMEQAGNYFALVNRQLFALVFWYILAGPIAALAYRLVTLCCDIELVSRQANQITDVLEWIPSRLTVLFFLLAGNFQHGFSLFARCIFANPSRNGEMLRACGLKAAQITESDEVTVSMAERLVEHALVVMLVFIALFTLFSYL